MNRRAFLRGATRLGASVAGVALLSGCDVRPFTGTRSAKAVRIGILHLEPSTNPGAFDAIRKGMRELRWMEGQDFTLPPSVASRVTEWLS